MVPLLAPLIGSLAGSAMGAGMSAGIASALGGGAIASMIGAAAPAALGAGIGTLAAGGDIGEAIGNAAMFGGGAGVMSAAGGGLGGLFSGPEAAAAAPTPVPASPTVAAPPPPPPPRPMPTTAAAPAMAPGDVMRTLQMAGNMMQPEPMPMPTGGMQPGVQQRGQGTGSAMGMFAQPQQAPSPFMGAPMSVQPVYGGLPTMYARDGGYIEGPGTGRSDSIPAKIYQDGTPVQEARLSDGEFVMTERAVRGAGDGDRAKGAAKMYRLMREFERGGRV